ncbi:hypothetical protein P5V15_000909 [Pogonomyrmex californicus]
MVDTIEKALKPFSFVAFFFGFGIFQYPLNYWRFRLSVFYILTVWSVYACVFHFIVNIFSPRHLFNGHLSFFMININFFVTVISVTITIRKHEKIHICIKKLGLVDDTLEKLGTPKKYHRMQNSIIWLLIIYLIVVLISLITDSIWNIEKHNSTKAISISFVMGYPFHVNAIGDIIFAFVIRYIGTRLDKINGYIEQLSETEEYGLRCKWNKSIVIRRHCIRSAKSRKHMLWTIM